MSIYETLPQETKGVTFYFFSRCPSSKLKVLLKCWRPHFRSPLGSALSLGGAFLWTLLMKAAACSPRSTPAACRAAQCLWGRAGHGPQKQPSKMPVHRRLQPWLANCPCRAPLTTMAILGKAELPEVRLLTSYCSWGKKL